MKAGDHENAFQIATIAGGGTPGNGEVQDRHGPARQKHRRREETLTKEDWGQNPASGALLGQWLVVKRMLLNEQAIATK